MFPKIKPIEKDENEEDYMFHWLTFLEMGKIGINQRPVGPMLILWQKPDKEPRYFLRARLLDTPGGHILHPRPTSQGYHYTNDTK